LSLKENGLDKPLWEVFSTFAKTPNANSTFIALGLAPLFLDATAYRMLGIGYLAIAVTRAFSVVFDQSFACKRGMLHHCYT
jgi:hypothetical protein